MQHPLWQLVLMRLREFYRHPEAVFWVYGFPIVMAVALGLAFRNRPIDRIPVDVEAHPRAEEVCAALAKDPRLEPSVQSAGDAARRLRTGKVALVVRLDSSHELLFDPTRPESLVARSTVDDALQRAAGRTDPLAVKEHLIDEPGGRYIDFLIPGLLGLNLLGGGLWGVGFVIVEMRVRKLMKRLLATPMRRWHLLLSVLGARLLFTVPEAVVLLLTGWLLFGMPIHGNLLAIVFLSFLGAMSFAGIGLLVASRARTQESVSGLMNLAMLPMWILSGTFFSSERFPDAMQPLVRALPLTQLNDSLRAVILEGASIATQAVPMAVMAAWGAGCFLLALRWFRWS